MYLKYSEFILKGKLNKKQENNLFSYIMLLTLKTFFQLKVNCHLHLQDSKKILRPHKKKIIMTKSNFEIKI